MIPTRLVDTDSDGTPFVGTIHNNAWLQSLQDKIDAEIQKVLTPSTVTGAQNNYAPTGFATTAGHCTLPWNGAADATFSGFTAGINGQRVTWINITSSKVAYFKHANASSSSGNKFQNLATSGDTPIAAGGSCTFEYDTSSGTGVWRLIAHEQGAPITVAYAGGNFTSTATWTVDPGDAVTMTSKMSGKTLEVTFDLATTSITTGATSAILAISNAAYGGFTWAKSSSQPCIVNDNAAGFAAGHVLLGTNLGGSVTAISILKLPTANWAASTNNTSVSGSVRGEVT